MRIMYSLCDYRIVYLCILFSRSFFSHTVQVFGLFQYFFSIWHGSQETSSTCEVYFDDNVLFYNTLPSMPVTVGQIGLPYDCE